MIYIVSNRTVTGDKEAEKFSNESDEAGANSHIIRIAIIKESDLSLENIPYRILKDNLSTDYQKVSDLIAQSKPKKAAEENLSGTNSMFYSLYVGNHRVVYSIL